MSRASDLEAARLAKERVDNRCEAIETANSDLLSVLAAQMLAEGSSIAERGRKGWQSAEREHIRAAAILEQWARDLAAYLERDKPPMRPPLDTITGPTRHAHLDPADGPISAQITSGLMTQASDGPVTADVARAIREAKTVDGRLDVAFGPVSPRLTGLELPVHITAAPANYAWCDVTTGARGYVGAATCPDCIARYDAYDEAADKALALKPSTPVPRVVLLTGSRDWTEVGQIHDTLAGMRAAIPGLVIRHGDCKTGADAIAKAWCDANGLAQDSMPADWSTHGKAAGPIRNQAMLDKHPTPETYVAFHKGGSRGTADMIERCEKADIQGNVYGPIFSEPGSALTTVAELPIRPISAVAWGNNGEGEATVSIPQFSEPGPAPARQTQQRMSFDAVREHGMARARGADHRSYSQVSSFAECGVRYALGDLETPAWWNVGGTAVHYACEWLNRDGHANSLDDWSDFTIETLWTNCLNRATSEAIAEHPTVGPDRWRAAKKGAEGYDWWRVNGVDMVRRWVTRLAWLYDQGWRVAEFNGIPAIEYDCPMWIGDIKVENIIDLVLTRDDGTLLIVDAKSGASAPDSTAQLGQYAHALNYAIGGDEFFRTNTPIFGAYWLARTDALGIGTTDLRDLHPWDEIEYLITTMHAAESAGLYLPNRTRWCVSCGVNGLCPVGPR